MACTFCLGLGPWNGGAWAEPHDLTNQTGSGLPFAAEELAGQPVTGVYRTVDAAGVVEFNDFGVGESVSLVVIPAAGEAERARLAERNLSIVAVADQLAADRAGREQSQRDAQALRAEHKRALAREAAAAPRAANGYYPNFGWPRWHNARRRSGARPPLYQRDYRRPRPDKRHGRGHEHSGAPAQATGTSIMRDRGTTP